MGELEKYINDRIKYVDTRLKTIYDKRLENARDKSLAHRIAQEKASNIYSFLQYRYRPHGWGLSNINKLYKENKNGRFPTYDDAILYYTRAANSDNERNKTLKNIGTLEAYSAFCTILVQRNGSQQANKFTPLLAQATEPVVTTLFPVSKFMLSDMFENSSKHDYIMDLLVVKGYCQQKSNIWKDEKKGSKGLLVSILKYLHIQGYYKKNRRLTIEQIKEIAQNTFGIEISIATIKATKLENYNLDFIPPAASVK